MHVIMLNNFNACCFFKIYLETKQNFVSITGISILYNLPFTSCYTSLKNNIMSKK